MTPISRKRAPDSSTTFVPQTDGHSVDDVFRAPRMSLLDHLQTICPTTPMSSVLDFRTKPPKVKGKEATSWEWGGQLLHLQNIAETLQHIAVVTHRKLFSEFWRHCSEPLVGSCSSTENKQQPSNWTSLMSAILSNNTACSFNLEVICAAMKDGWPTGTPRTLRPCWAWGNDHKLNPKP